MRRKTSKYKGVSKFRNKWRARFQNHTLGVFKTELEAGIAYNEASLHKNELSNEFVCWRCRKFKDSSAFYSDPRKRTGVSSTCKQCQATFANINKVLERLGLPKDDESLIYIKNMRILKLLEKNKVTKDEARNLYDRETAYGCFDIRLKR